MPRSRRPSRGIDSSQRGRGTSILSSLLGEETGDYEINEFSGKQPGEVDFRYKGDPSELVSAPKYQDRRGFISKLFGTPNTAGELNLNQELLSQELDKQLALERERNNLEKDRLQFSDSIKKNRETEEDEVRAEAFDLLSGGQKEDNSFFSPLTAQESERLVSAPLMIPQSRRGAIYRNLYGNAPAIPGVAQAESLRSSALGTRDKADIDREILGRSREDLVSAGTTGARSSRIKAETDNELLSSPDYKRTLITSTLAKILKEGATELGPNQVQFLPDGSMNLGPQMVQELIPTLLAKDPKTGAGIYGEPKVRQSFTDPTRLPAVSPEDIQRFKGAGSNPSISSPSPTVQENQLLSAPAMLQQMRGLLSAPVMKDGKVEAKMTPKEETEEEKKKRQEKEKQEILSNPKIRGILDRYNY